MPPKTRSQPVPQRATRASSRKRRLSDASDVSDTPSSQAGGAAGKPSKRRKRGRPAKHTVAPTVIPEEDEEMMQDTELPTSDAIAAGESDANDEDEIEVTQPADKRVHFETTAGDEVESSTATFITPYPRQKMTVKRRTVSTGAGEDTQQLEPNRNSLPATLSHTIDSTSYLNMQDTRLTPLKQALENRIRRIPALQESTPLAHAMGEDAMMDDDMLVLDGQADEEEPEKANQLMSPPPTQNLVSSPLQSRSDEAKAPRDSFSTIRMGWNAERDQFHDAIIALQEQADRATSQLRILSIELGAIGFGEAGAAPLAILESIRQSFDKVREFLDDEFPGSVPEDATNQDLLEILIANVRELAARLRTTETGLRQKTNLASNLGRQVDGLLTRLATTEVKKRPLTDQWTKLDQQNDDKAREIDSLQSDVQTAKEERDDLARQRNEQAARADGLEEERTDLENNLDRLSKSLQEYRDEETRLSNMINNMEEEHRNTVEAMNREREETVRDLYDQLEQATTTVHEMETIANDRQIAIDNLTTLIEATEMERNTLRDEVEQAREKLAAETEAKEAAESELETKNIEVENLEDRVGRLEEQLQTLNNELAKLRGFNETERGLREVAEADLEERNAELDSLDAKLHEQGKQANELRQKLFEAQTNNAQKVKELESMMSDRDAQFQDDMAEEIQRRQVADELALERAATISDLEKELDDIEHNMRTQLAERDASIEELRDSGEQKDAEFQLLSDDLRSTKNVHSEEVAAFRGRITELETGVLALQETISEHEQSIQNLQQQAVEAVSDQKRQTVEHNAFVADLQNRIALLQAEKETLEKDKASLEHRVEAEAASMLEFSNDKMDEVESLRKIIRDKQAKILTVEEKARTADARWEEVLNARDAQIDVLTDTNTKLANENTELVDQNEQIRGLFKGYIARASERLLHLEENVEDSRAYAENQRKMENDDVEDMLEDLRDLQVPNGGHAGKESRGRKRKRVYDSGVGLDGPLFIDDDMIPG